MVPRAFFLAKISSAGFRAPAPFAGLSVNHCKSPTCANFGVPERPFRVRRIPGTPPEPGDYILVAAGAGKPMLKCVLCGETTPMRSNQGVHEELTRLIGYLAPPGKLRCPSAACSASSVPPSEPGELYVQFGKTAAGTPRYRCKICRRTFSGAGRPAKRQRMPHKNREVFALLINKVPLRRMAEVTGLSAQTLYDKFAFIHRQCLAFAASRERQLQKMVLPKLYLATDRQTLAVNWTNRKDRRNIMLQAIATADLHSGYVFGMDLNFDPSLDLDDVEVDAAAAGDLLVAQPYRRFARLWLRIDYEAALVEAKVRKVVKTARKHAYRPDPLTAAIEDSYADAAAREDVQEVSTKDTNERLPMTGVEVRDQYTVYAHFFMLAGMLGHAPKIRCFLDQDSGFRAAFMAAFHRQVRERRADAWFVKVLKETSIDVKDAAVLKTKLRFEGTKAANPHLSDHDVQVLMVIEEMSRMREHGKWDDRWLTHPVASPAEPGKQVCWLTDIDAPADDSLELQDQQLHKARLFLKASLHAVDRFFMQVRRRLTLAERPYATASSDRRMWHGYSAYQPKNLAMVLAIFRVAYNYCLVDSKGKTPAMRMGLAKAPIALEDILYFTPSA
jgi:transposase-like protein